jgi:protein ImuB
MFACIFIPDFSVAAIVRNESGLRDQPVAVLDGTPPLLRVIAINEKARQAGVELEMTRMQVEDCPQLVVRRRSPLAESSAHAALLDAAQSFSPVVEDAACDTALLDLAGMESLLGEPAKMAHDLGRGCAEFGLDANVAVATNADAALHAARGLSGTTVIPAGKEAEQLGRLSLEVLFAGATTPEQQKEAQRFLETLDRWGVRTFRGLATLPTVALSERLGQKGLQYQRLARGATERTLVPLAMPPLFEESMELEHPLSLLEPLVFLLGRLLEQICARLTARALAAQELQLRLELDLSCQEEDASVEDTDQRNVEAARTPLFRRTLRLPVPMLDARVFLKLLQLDLQAHPPGAPILKVWLKAEPAPPRATQNGLFLPAGLEPEQLELTLARLAKLVTARMDKKAAEECRVGAPALLDSYQPEAFRVERFVAPEETAFDNNFQSVNDGPQGLKPKSFTLPNGTAEATPYPIFIPKTNSNPGALFSMRMDETNTALVLRVFRPLLAATVTLHDGKPARVVCFERRELQGEVMWCSGPWRASGSWWGEETWMRDEWDVALYGALSVGLYRVCHDLRQGQWFVEGTYD